MNGKLAAPLTPGNDMSALKPVFSAAACCGLIVTPCTESSDDPIATATTFGQRITEMARALKRSS
jgi:hypothetical protein